MFFQLLLINLLILLNTTADSYAESYTMEDLEILVQDKSYDEYFNHALDIRPGSRKEKWKTMASQMADAFSRSILAHSEIPKEKFLQVEKIYQWPSLKLDDAFKIQRQEIGLRYLSQCLKSPTPCWSDLKTYWEQDQISEDNAFKLAQMVHPHKETSPIKVWTFLSVALKSPLSQFYCQKEFVIDSLWEALGVEYIKTANQGDFLKTLDDTIHYECLSYLNKKASQYLTGISRPTDRELAFQILLAQGKTNPELTDYFYVVYLLETPSRGDLFNYAWNRLTELSKYPGRREAVMDRLTQTSILPDQILSSLDLAKKKAIINHFRAHFPEYFEYYAKKCFEFFRGSGTFPLGNPTMYCQDLMSSEMAMPLFGKDKIEEFKELKKI